MIDVVYLAYSNKTIGYGIETVEKFLESYKSHPAGIEHNLIIAAKNWDDKNLKENLFVLSNENNATLIYLPDDGFDIGAYIRAAKILKNEYVLFLGSNIEILTDNWLSYFYKAFESDKSIQLVGPMGAWAKGLSGVFPNPHIRTTSFMIKRDLFLEYASTQKFPQTKADTYGMEHCSNSLTNFIFKKGYEAVVVNSDGKIFTHEKWPYSQTYFSMGESKLILSDKWVRHFESSNELVKIKTVMTEWGKNIEKYPKTLVKEFSEKINIFIPYLDIVEILTSNIFHPLFIGEINTRLETEALQDNTGENISDKNINYGELTGYYWIWKNFLPTTNSEYIGFCQYSRFLDFNIGGKDYSAFSPIFIDNFKKIFEEYTEENILNCIQGYDVILPAKINFENNIYEHYLKSHKKEDLDLAYDLIKKIYPEYVDSMNEVMSSNSIYLLGNFVMKKELLNEFLEWLFNILNCLEQKINWDEYGKYYDIVLSTFITDRLLNIWLVHNIKIKDLKIKSTTSFMLYYDFKSYMAECLNKIHQIQKQITG